MKFVDTNDMRGKIKSVSKSRLEKYQKCPLWAYKDLRNTKDFNRTRNLEIGILAHAIAAKKLADKVGIKREIFDLEEKYDLDVIYEVQEEIFRYTNFNYLYDKVQVIGIEETISFEMPEIEDEFNFIGRFDVVSFMEYDNQKYIVVDDFKSGFYISTEVDTEALVYSYAAYKHYNLPVIFRRIGLRNGKLWSKIFSKETLERMKDKIIFKIKHWKEEMEGELIPEYTPGTHCLYCSMLNTCQGRKDVSNLNKKFKASIWAKQYAKKMEAEVKNGAKEVLEHVPISEVGKEEILIPFLNNKYGATVSTTESYMLAGRKLKKRDIIKLLIETGEIENFIDNLDIKFDQELALKLETDYKIPFRKQVKSTIKLVEQKESEE